MSRILTALLAVSLLTGCGSMGGLRQIFSSAFTDAELDDAMLTGFTASLAREITELDQAQQVLQALGLPPETVKRLDGVILTIALRGEQDLREVYCVGEMAPKCREIPINTEIKLSAESTANGKLLPNRITWDRRP